MMWARKRIDISWLDLACAAGYVAVAESQEVAQRAAEAAAEEMWPEEGNGTSSEEARGEKAGTPVKGRVLACFTERTGFDLLLAAAALPADSEVLVSAITIDDMVRILEAHGLVPVPVDIDPRDMSLRIDRLNAAVTSRTRAVLFAHLFGVRCDMRPLVDWARPRGLAVWEVCAQALEGRRYPGHPQADAVMFSMGPIKTATALGGGLMRVRDAVLLQRMRELHAGYPVQARWSFACRVGGFAALKAASWRWVFGLLVRLCRILGRDYDRLLNAAVRNLPGDDFFALLRQRPSAPLLRLMQRRLESFDYERLDRRAAKGRLLVDLLDGTAKCPGSDAREHTFWVFPVCAADPARAVEAMRRAGFDATAGSQLRAVAPSPGREELDPSAARELLRQSVFLPAYPEMPDGALRRMAAVAMES